MNHRNVALLLLAVVVTGAIVPSLAVLANKSERPLEKITIIHWRENGKPGGGGGKPPAGDSGDYKLLAQGFKWKSSPVLTLDYENTYGISQKDFASAVKLAVDQWDSNAKVLLVSSYQTDLNSNWDSDQPDGRNEIVFGNYQQSGVIAVTTIWGYFSGPISRRQITEFDIMLDTDWTWGTSGTSEYMDLQNILTHELGHGFGLADLYTASSSLETMYGYSNYGDVAKRDLYTGDIAGIQALYGAP
jgi:hypothetical protein